MVIGAGKERAYLFFKDFQGNLGEMSGPFGRVLPRSLRVNLLVDIKYDHVVIRPVHGEYVIDCNCILLRYIGIQGGSLAVRLLSAMLG